MLGVNIVEFFFFQAEDGIRTYKVTGVQTCALPISQSKYSRRSHQRKMGQSQVQYEAREPLQQTEILCYRCWIRASWRFCRGDHGRTWLQS